jgi:hypothetical protein
MFHGVGVLTMLYANGRGTGTGKPFDLCDSATSGLSGGQCMSVQTRFAEVEREEKFAQATASLNPAQRKLFDKLRAAVEKFADARGNEVDMTGTMRYSFARGDHDKILGQFLINLQRFSKLDVPAASPVDDRRLDAQMNSLDQALMSHPPDTRLGGTTVQPAGIRETQRAWLGLRDAWLAFAAAAYPGLSADRVHAQLLNLRLNQLRRLPVDP